MTEFEDLDSELTELFDGIAKEMKSASALRGTKRVDVRFLSPLYPLRFPLTPVRFAGVGLVP